MNDANVNPMGTRDEPSLGSQLIDLPALDNGIPRFVFLSPSPEEIREMAQNEGCDI